MARRAPPRLKPTAVRLRGARVATEPGLVVIGFGPGHRLVYTPEQARLLAAALREVEPEELAAELERAAGEAHLLLYQSRRGGFDRS